MSIVRRDRDLHLRKSAKPLRSVLAAHVVENQVADQRGDDEVSIDAPHGWPSADGWIQFLPPIRVLHDGSCLAPINDMCGHVDGGERLLLLIPFGSREAGNKNQREKKCFHDFTVPRVNQSRKVIVHTA